MATKKIKKKISPKKLVNKKLTNKKLAPKKLVNKKLTNKKLAPKKLVSKKLANKKLAPKKLVNKKLANKKLAPKKLVSKKLANKKLAPKKLVNKKLADEKLAPKKLVSKKLANKKLAPKKLVNKKLANKKLAPKKLVSKKLADEKLAPKKLVSKKLVSKKSSKNFTTSLIYREKELEKLLDKEQEEKHFLKNLEGRKYCILENCDYPAIVEDYCRLHFFGLYTIIQKKKKILEKNVLEKTFSSLVNQHSESIFEHLFKDISTDKDFKYAIKKIIDEDSDELEEDSFFLD